MTHHQIIGRRMGGNGMSGAGANRLMPGVRRMRRPRRPFLPYQYAMPYYAEPYPYPPQDDEEETQDDVLSGRSSGGAMRGMARPARRRRMRRPELLQEEPLEPLELSEEDEIDERERAKIRKAAVVSGNELFSLLPILAPGSEGMTFDFDVDDGMCLHVSICVDGQCYEASTDLSAVLAEIAQRVAASRGSGSEDPQAVQDVGDQADEAVESASQMLVGALFNEHIGEITAGFFDSLKSVYQKASTPVTWFNKQVFKVLQYPPLKKAVTVAASAVATAYGGPAAGAAAAQFVGPVIDSSAETGGDPLKHFEDAKKEAVAQSSSPEEAQATVAAIDTAKTAIAQTAAAYHLTGTASAAAAGDGKAAEKIAQLERAASSGDSGAIQAMKIIAQAFAAAGVQGGDAASIDLGVPTTSGAERARTASAIARSIPRDQARAMQHEGSIAAQTLRDASGAQFIGFLQTRSSASESYPGVVMDDTTQVMPLSSADHAAYWLDETSVDPDTAYAAWYDAEGILWPAPVNETFGPGTAGSWQVEAPGSAPGVVGMVPWWLAGVLGAGGGYAAGRWLSNRQHHPSADNPGQAIGPIYASQAHPDAPTTSGALGILPWIAMAAAGGAGWYGRAWWEARQTQLAAAKAASDAEAAAHGDPAFTAAKSAAHEFGDLVNSPAPTPVTTSGW